MDENKLLERITTNPEIFNGKPIIRGRRLAVEHVLGMIAARDTIDSILEDYPWIEREDIQACLSIDRSITGLRRAVTYTDLITGDLGKVLDLSMVAELRGEVVGFIKRRFECLVSSLVQCAFTKERLNGMGNGIVGFLFLDKAVEIRKAIRIQQA